MSEEAVTQREVRVARYLTFILGEEEYGIESLLVQEIIGMLPITPVPGTPYFVLGVLNLRGAIVPVIDLRKKFDMFEREITRETCIIVTRYHSYIVGLLADSACDVVNISSDVVQHPECFTSSVQAQYVMGIAANEKRPRILIDSEAVISDGLGEPDSPLSSF